MFSTSRESLSMPDAEVLSDEELVKLVEEMRKKVELLRLENEVLEQSILRLQPSLLTGVSKTLEYAIRVQTGLGSSSSHVRSHNWRTESLSKVTSTVKMTSSGKVASSGKIVSLGRVVSSGRVGSSSRLAGSIITSGSIIGLQGPKVNVEEKLELVYALMENQWKALEKCKNNAKKQKAYLKAQFEEIDLRITDIDKLVVDFDQQVVVDGWDPIAHRIPAEIWIRFLTEQAKKIDRKMDKLRIRVSTLNVRFRKLKDDIRRKEDLRSRLTPVDFQQKMIEIQENIKMIDFKNEELIHLKELTGDANLSLTIHKKQMLVMEKYVDQVNKLKTQRQHQTVKVIAQKGTLQTQVDILQSRVDEIRKLKEAYLVPDVMEYVQVKLRVSDLNHAIQHLETRLNIKQSNLANLRKQDKREKVLQIHDMVSLTYS